MADSETELRAPPGTRTSTSDEPVQAEILVGEAVVTFLVDYALLTDNRSPLLKHSLKKYDGCVHLEEDDPEVFLDYWICIKYGADKIEFKPGCDGANGDVDVFAGLAEVWILAHKLMDFRTANEMVDEFQRLHKITGQFPKAASINTIFVQTSRYSRLRTLVEDYFVLEASLRDYERLRAQGVNGDFWFAVGIEMRGLVEQAVGGVGRLEDGLAKRVDQKPVCDYHLFDAEGCASCRFA